ncbi:16S rRNA (guanine(966)-N(2))-methyltransferase RsmD [Pseudoalteromonas fenneropenaei]|uniref:Ribosomal RNA small subunit methyltransferase D n=1 Tax=Pseudoalteromonas fenneropenaei TaxID=1737459 RepID=A0ABV7CFU5_9GAMM
MRNKSTSSHLQAGFIRIIGGKYRGRKLPVKDVQGLRPTTDRVKETLFNWLMNDIRDSAVLDCFAGSGGLGFEALSRFAKNARLIEKDQAAAAQLIKNVQALGLTNADVQLADTLQLLQRPADQSFDVVFIDPPFRMGLANCVCRALEQNHWLNSSALIYIEVEQELALETPANWQLLKEKQAGQVAYRLYLREEISVS